MNEITIKVGRKYVSNNREVEVVTDVDPKGKVCVRNPDGSLSMTEAHRLKLLTSERIHAWITNGGNLTIRQSTASGQMVFVTVPKELFQALRQIMFTKKAFKRTELEPTNLSFEEREGRPNHENIGNRQTTEGEIQETGEESTGSESDPTDEAESNS